jgi:REP element-mobilizing transposase RayT
VPEFGEPIRNAVWDTILAQRSTERVALVAACLMPDHVHLLVRPAALDLLAFVRTWKSYTTHLARGLGHLGGLWQPGMWDRTIRDTEDLERTVAYIVNNPVTASLVDAPDDWPWTWPR